MDDTAMVTTDALCKRYGAHLALDHVDVRVPRGAVYGLVGPNGAGKTTLLGIVAGLRRPTSGSVSVRAAPGRVAVLADTPRFDPWLTGWEVVDLARVLSGVGGGGATDAALARVGLAEAADRRCGGYSRGMLQRLGIAAAIVGEPELVVLDEPCSALDPAGRREVLDLVGRLAETATVVFSSHILADVQDVSDTVGVLRAGRMVFEGPLRALLVGRAAPGYRLRVRRPVEPVADVLASQAWVHDVQRSGSEELVVTVVDLGQAEAGLAAALAAAGAHLVRVEPLEADLERVFLEVTA